MAAPDQALATQRRNIGTKIGRDLETVRTEIAASGKLKHGEVRTWLIENYGLAYGDANSLAHFASGSKGAPPEPSSDSDPLAEIYAGKKQHLRAIHDALIGATRQWGECEIAPKKAYVALRRWLRGHIWQDLEEIVGGGNAVGRSRCNYTSVVQFGTCGRDGVDRDFHWASRLRDRWRRTVWSGRP